MKTGLVLLLATLSLNSGCGLKKETSPCTKTEQYRPAYEVHESESRMLRDFTPSEQLEYFRKHKN